MTGYALPIKRLIQELGRLPGIGEKTATRLATHILRLPEEDAGRLADSILEVKRRIRLCSLCFNLAEGELTMRNLRRRLPGPGGAMCGGGAGFADCD